jgi:sugar-specific transcriptional regulator TrmB
MLRLLISLGIGKVDAEVYLYLATTGPKKGRKLCNELKMDKQKLYRSLRRLKEKGLVKASSEHAATFAAITVEESLDYYLEAKLEEAQYIKEKKDELLSRWRSMINNNSSNNI